MKTDADLWGNSLGSSRGVPADKTQARRTASCVSYYEPEGESAGFLLNG